MFTRFKKQKTYNPNDVQLKKILYGIDESSDERTKLSYIENSIFYVPQSMLSVTQFPSSPKTCIKNVQI